MATIRDSLRELEEQVRRLKADTAAALGEIERQLLVVSSAARRVAEDLGAGAAPDGERKPEPIIAPVIPPAVGSPVLTEPEVRLQQPRKGLFGQPAAKPKEEPK